MVKRNYNVYQALELGIRFRCPPCEFRRYIFARCQQLPYAFTVQKIVIENRQNYKINYYKHQYHFIELF